MAYITMDEVIDRFNILTEKPVKFLTVQKDLKEDVKSLVKTLYDFTKSQEQVLNKEKNNALPELIVEDFDEEQIWQEIELQNNACWDNLVWEVANSMSGKHDLKFPVEVLKKSDKSKTNSSHKNEDSLSNNEMSDDLSELDEDNEKEDIPIGRKVLKSTSKRKKSVVDDKFFKLQDMEKFLLKEENQDVNKAASGSDDEESIDMFDDIDDEDSDEEDGGNDVMYKDFFDAEDNIDDGKLDDITELDDVNYEHESESIKEEPKNKVVKKQLENKQSKDKKVRFANILGDESDGDSIDSNIATDKVMDKGKVIDKGKDEKKSDFEHRQERLKQTINRLEEKSLKDAPWQLKGEVDALKRPQNSLLQEVVDFDLTSRPAPIITEETTLTLEEIITRRIKDKAWDDVIKKDKPVDDQLSFRKTEVLDQSKSKLSLAQVYEAEYLKQKQALTGENDEEKEPDSHKEIREAMTTLFSKLDALCHYHYTPKPPQAEVKIVTNTPAISMEEVAPVATSDATLLAPEEVKKKRRGDLMSKEERTQTDRNRERRKKKKMQQKKGKVMKVTEHRNTKKGIEANDKSLKTSKAFFQQLNDATTSLIKSKKHNKNKG